MLLLSVIGHLLVHLYPFYVQKIETDGMTRSILLLLAMLICIVILIHASSWKLTKMLGTGMFVLYFAFLVQAIILER